MKIFLSITLVWACCIASFAQSSRIGAGLEAQTGVTTKGIVPFWMRSNQFGSVPLAGPSASFIGHFKVDYDTSSSKLVKWATRLEGRANLGKGSNFTLIEGSAGIKIGIFELKGGRMKEVMGLSDTTLTSGNFAISGNALGIPKVQISIPEFYTLPFWGGILAFKGNFAHGWIGKTPVQYGDTNMLTTQFHQKSLYGRFGKPEWKLRVYGGFNHQVFFGEEKYIWSKELFGGKNVFDLSGWQTYQYVIFGKVWNDSKVGNHMGSIDLGLTYDFKGVQFLAYHQFFYETGGLAHLSNLRDGLNGISIKNTSNQTRNFRWNKLLFEFLFTKNQGGESWSKVTPSGDEDYYNNYLYTEGWSYKNSGLGNPLLTTKNDSRTGLPNYPYDYFINNRVVAYQIGFDSTAFKWQILSKLSYSINHGTFGTSPVGHTTGELHTEPIYGFFPKSRQFSGLLSLRRELAMGFNVGFTAALDHGKLLRDSQGLFISAAKVF